MTNELWSQCEAFFTFFCAHVLRIFFCSTNRELILFNVQSQERWCLKRQYKKKSIKLTKSFCCVRSFLMSHCVELPHQVSYSRFKNKSSKKILNSVVVIYSVGLWNIRRAGKIFEDVEISKPSIKKSTREREREGKREHKKMIAKETCLVLSLIINHWFTV